MKNTTFGGWLKEIEIREKVSGYELAPLLGLSGHNYYGKYRHSEKLPTTFQRRMLELIDTHGIDVLRRRMKDGMIKFESKPEYRQFDGKVFLSNYCKGGFQDVPEFNMLLSDLYSSTDTKPLIDNTIGIYEDTRYSYYQILELLASKILDLWQIEAVQGIENRYDEVLAVPFLEWLEDRMEALSKIFQDDSSMAKIISTIQRQLEELHKYSAKSIAKYRKDVHKA